MSNSAAMEPYSKNEKNGTPKKDLVEDEDEYPGILPCQGRKGGLYPGVSHPKISKIELHSIRISKVIS